MLDGYDEISPFYKQTVKIRSTDPFKTSSSNYLHKNFFVMRVIKKGIEIQKVQPTCHRYVLFLNMGLGAGIHAEREG